MLLLDDGPIEVGGTIATVAPSGDGGWVVGVDFDDLDRAVTDAIVSWCFRFPFGARLRRRCPCARHVREPGPDGAAAHEDSALAGDRRGRGHRRGGRRRPDAVAGGPA